FWNLRVAQYYMARCAEKQGTPKTGYVTCALRRAVWRVAQGKHESAGLVLEDARCAGPCRALRWLGPILLSL
ncbi:hypothetical protein A2U01_0082436, partial [Trifolium medium]|nr:hypothetical protein [Trifolium medium]